MTKYPTPAHPVDETETQAPPSMCLANARIVLEDRVITGALHIDAGKIAEIFEGDDVPNGAVNCQGDILLPGLVELHTDNLERHMQPRPKVELPHKNAILAHDGELASVGITTVFDALRIGAISDESQHSRRYARAVASEILEMRAAGVLRVRHLLHLRAEVCSDSLQEEFAEFGLQDPVGLVSLMDHTPGQRQFRDMAKLRTYYKGKYGYSDAEFEAVVSHRSALAARVRSLHETSTVAEAARLGATLASHDDTTHTHVAHSRKLGIRLAEFPTTLQAAQACRDAGMSIIMGAPNLIRGSSHSGNVSATELAAQGLLDIISSDYVPSLLLASAFRLAQLWDDLPRAIRTVTSNPAEATGLSDRGRIAQGNLADILRIQMLGDTPVVRSVWRGGAQIG